MEVLRIGEVAQATGVSAANIRYYEKQGLLPVPARQDNAYRRYSADDVHRLRFIRLCRAMDMSLEEVRTLLALDWSCDTDCQQASVTVGEHLVHVRARIAELQSLAQTLETLLGHCQGAGQQPCGLIAALHAQADRVTQLPLPTAATSVKRHV